MRNQFVCVFISNHPWKWEGHFSWLFPQNRNYQREMGNLKKNGRNYLTAIVILNKNFHKLFISVLYRLPFPFSRFPVGSSCSSPKNWFHAGLVGRKDWFLKPFFSGSGINIYVCICMNKNSTYWHCTNVIHMAEYLEHLELDADATY